MIRKFIQKRMANIRNAKNISARKLSLELGQSSEYINQIENGKNIPSIEGLINFCSYLNISMGEFFEENFEYPVQYREIIKNLNKLDAIELEKVSEIIKLIADKK